MKHLSIVVLLLMASFNISKAQISLMPKVGVTFSDVKFSEESNIIQFRNALAKVQTRAVVGLLAGIGVNFKVTNFFSIQQEFSYIQKGYRREGKITFAEFPGYLPPYYENIRFSYLEFPLLAKLSVGNNNKKGFLNFGPYVSYNLGGKVIIGYPDREDIGKVKFGERPIYSSDIYYDNRIDYGIQAGGGFGVKVGPGLLTADFRLIIGMGDLYDGGKSKNTTFCTNLAYFIPLGE